METLLLLSKGETIFQGKAQKIIPYMEKIGVKINKKMNPADFFMMQVSEYKKMKGYITPMNADTF